MLEKLKLNKNLWNQYDELFKLTNKQKEMHNKFKSTCKEKKINKEIKKEIVSLIYSPTSLHDFKNLEENYYTIKETIPYYMKKKKKEGLSSAHNLYLEFLHIIKENFEKFTEYQYAIKKQSFPDTNIYDLLSVVEKIQTNLYQETINTLLDVLKYSNEKIKIELAIKVFLLCESNIDLDTINNISRFIKNTDNLSTLEDINTIIGKVYYIGNKDFKSSKFINLLMSKKDGEYEENLLRETINLLYKDGYLIKYLEPAEIDIIYYILKKENKTNIRNINTILSIITDNKFYNIKDKELRKNILNTLLTIDILSEKNIWIYKKYMLDIYAKCEYENIKEYLLEKLKEIKSIKSLKLIIDIYPNIISHIAIEDTTKVIDNIVDFEKLSSTKKKELVIPIKDDK